MNQPLTPEAAPKKGMSTFVKVLLGCGVLLLLGIGSCVVVSGYFLKKGVGKLSDFAKEMETNPDAAIVRAAELTLRLNPEVEVLSSDPAAGTITVREKKSGKKVTFNLEDIKEGKFSIDADGQKTSVDLDASEENGGQMKVVTDQGTAVFGAGAEPESGTGLGARLSRRSHRRSGEHRGQGREVGDVHPAHLGCSGHGHGVLRIEAEGGRIRSPEGEPELRRCSQRNAHGHHRERQAPAIDHRRGAGRRNPGARDVQREALSGRL